VTVGGPFGSAPPPPFRLGDLVADPFDRLYLVRRKPDGFGIVRVSLWNGTGFDPVRYQLPADSLRAAPEDWSATKAIRTWEADRQVRVQGLLRRAPATAGGAR
jgi:hypothetical protein